MSFVDKVYKESIRGLFINLKVKNNTDKGRATIRQFKGRRDIITGS
jgi:hypothetical protein